jgi:hypothetical protein
MSLSEPAIRGKKVDTEEGAGEQGLVILTPTLSFSPEKSHPDSE